MQAIVKLLIDQLNTGVFVLLVALVAIGFLLWTVSAFKAKWEMKHDQHEKKLTSAGEVKDKVIALETNVGKAVEFGERIVRIETKLDLIFQKVSPNPFAQTQSPIALTTEGENLSKKINIPATLDRIYPALNAFIQQYAPKTAYDIQEAAFSVVRDHLLGLLSESEINALKDEAFNKGLPLDSLLIIYSVILRDKTLNERGIPVKDVDEHDPAYVRDRGEAE